MIFRYSGFDPLLLLKTKIFPKFRSCWITFGSVYFFIGNIENRCPNGIEIQFVIVLTDKAVFSA